MTTADSIMNRWILVIDDNPAICEDFRKILAGHANATSSDLLAARATLFEDTPLDDTPEDFEVDCADQGETALAMVQSALQRGCPYAVAFVDMLMPPGWDGIETIEHLWRVDPELEIVICTAFTDIVRDRLPQRFEHSDKLLILRKPFDNIEVWLLASVLTQKWHLGQQVKRQLAPTAMVEQRTRELQAVSERLQAEMARRQQAEEALTRQAHDLALSQAILEQLAWSATRMQQLIQDLLDYARVETRQQAFARTDVEQVLASVLANLQAVIAANGAVVTHDPLPTVMADAAQLGQVLQHLVDHAIKFCGTQSPLVHVRAERQGAGWIFTVRDNGTGLDPAHVERILRRFQPLSSQTEYPEAGLELAICHKIVERHGGRIWVESAPGSGTTFFFTIPISDPSDQESPDGA
jgi:signal transduction histidine kinase